VGTTGKICPEDDGQHVISGILEKGERLAGSRMQNEGRRRIYPGAESKNKKMSSILSEANKNQKPQGFCQNILSPRFGENRAQVKALDKMDSKITTVCFPKRPIKRLIVKLKII
jgi:hypothetical protein